jgi:histidyl-tRNA synthetase
MTKIEPRLLKGFRDYGPSEQLARQNMFSKIQSVFERFGFLPLSTPALEYKEILMGKYGEDEKLVYSFKDNGDRDVAMRYDLTVPLARYIAQNQGRLTLPFKRYQIAPVWRADNPQKGRLREFYQCDVDAVGTDAALADAEVIACLAQALEAVGVSGYRIRLNDRSVLSMFTKDSIRAIDKLDKIGIEGVVKEMREKGVPNEDIENAQKLGEAGAPENVQKLIELIGSFGLKGQIEFDPTIARGLDYYTGTVFEIYLTDQPEFGSICSGGRYDNLVDQYSNQSLPAVGGSIGIDRLIDALKDKGVSIYETAVQVLILNLDERFNEQYAKLASGLRTNGVSVELYYSAAKLDKQFKYAESKNIPYGIVMGEAEIEKGVAQLKNLLTREQEELPQTEIIKKMIQESA